MKVTADVIVVGAGPAGARTARDLAFAGFRVVILEEHSQIGTPCHCSGLVTPRTLDVAKAGPGLVLNKVSGVTIHVSPEEVVRLTGRKVHAYAIDRAELDRRLVDQAIDAGAEIWPRTRLLEFATVGSTRAGKGRVEIVARQSSGLVKLSSLLLIGADGARSRVAMGIRKTRPRRLIRGLGAEAIYHGNPLQDHVEIFLDQKSAPGWFAWTIPLGNGIARLGTGSANGMPARESLQRMRARFPESLGSATFTSRTGGAIALWEPNKIIDDRVMLVGDAARQVKPTSGGGILTGLLSASLAAETAARALRGGDLSSSAMRSYPARWDLAIGRELRRQHDMRRAFDRLGERQLALLVTTLRHPKIRSQIEWLADIDFPSQLVWQLFTHCPWIALKAATLPRFPTAWLPSPKSLAIRPTAEREPGNSKRGSRPSSGPGRSG